MPSPSSNHAVLESEQAYVEVTPEPLRLEALVTRVAAPAAGAVATFTGTTRDSFMGKRTKRLEYEAYVPMAAKKLQDICQQACARWQLVRVAVAHRTGLVGVGEASVVIAASSAHRRDALEAVAWVIDELKATVPIWKKEFFEGGEVWKENEESRALMEGPARARRAQAVAAADAAQQRQRQQQQVEAAEDGG